MFESTISSDIKLMHRKLLYSVPAYDIIRNEGNKNEFVFNVLNSEGKIFYK